MTLGPPEEVNVCHARFLVRSHHLCRPPLATIHHLDVITGIDAQRARRRPHRRLLLALTFLLHHLRHPLLHRFDLHLHRIRLLLLRLLLLRLCLRLHGFSSLVLLAARYRQLELVRFKRQPYVPPRFEAGIMNLHFAVARAHHLCGIPMPSVHRLARRANLGQHTRLQLLLRSGCRRRRRLLFGRRLRHRRRRCFGNGGRHVHLRRVHLHFLGRTARRLRRVGSSG